jgi:hypothetical protein
MTRLIDTLPTSYNSLEHMIGAVAFERSFAELYSVLQDNDPCSVSDSVSIVIEAIRKGESPYIDVAHKGIVHVFGGQCGFDDMEKALAGFLAEAEERFIMRAAEVEAVQIRANLKAFFDDGSPESWDDAASAFKR